MKTLLKSVLVVVLSLLSLNVYASKNPIGWTLDRTFPVPATIGTSTTITYTLTNNLPFTLVKPLVITKNGTPSADFTYVDNCNGVKLSSGGTCTVKVTLDPTTSGNISFQLIISGYSNDRVPLPLLTTRTSGSESNGLSGQVVTSLPSSLAVGSSGTYSFSFTNTSSSTLSGVSVTSNESSSPSYTKQNCGTTLGTGQTCTVSGIYTPTASSPATQSVYATFNFDQGSSVTETTSTSVTASNAVIGHLISPFELPAIMVGGVGKTIKFNFVNYSQTQAATIVSATVVASGGAWVPDSGANFNCDTVGSLAAGTGGEPGGGCNMYGTFTPPAMPYDTSYTVTATIAYKYAGVDQPDAVVTTSTTVVQTINTFRIIKFINNCPFDVWWSFHGSATSQTSCTATQSGDQGTCTTGSSCYLPHPTTSHTGSCFWNNPAPESGSSYHLLANNGSGTNYAHIPLTSVDPTYQWSGAISASTLCSGTSCGQADCSRSNVQNSNGDAGDNACAVGVGFEQPATQAEPTFLIAGADAYDVETINGFHIPISMAPDSTVTANNYYCGTAASSSAGNGFGACDWSATTRPSPYYNWVTPSSTACGAAPTYACGGGELCGISLTRSTATLSDLHCGQFLGYWTPDQACSLANAPSSFQCTTPKLPTSGTSFPSGATYYDLMKCSVTTGSTNPLYNTCYKSYPGYSSSQIKTCCGCVDWWDSSQTGGVTILANSTATACPAGQTDPSWTSVIRPMVQWMKKACPSAYVYPFDDKSSSFTCSNNVNGSANSVGYTITFCPGNSGIPTGVTAEGRGSSA